MPLVPLGFRASAANNEFKPNCPRPDRPCRRNERRKISMLMSVSSVACYGFVQVQNSAGDGGHRCQLALLVSRQVLLIEIRQDLLLFLRRGSIERLIECPIDLVLQFAARRDCLLGEN